MGTNVNPSAAAAIVNTAQSAYAAADPYDDAVADPEPDCFYDGSCSPPVGSGSYAIADQSAGNAYTNVNPSAAAAIVNTAQSAYAAADPYDDAVADPEPDCYYTNDCTAADLTSGGYAVVGSAAAGVYNTASNQATLPSYADAVNSVYDPC